MRLLTITYDWDSGTLTMDDASGHLQEPAVKAMGEVVRCILNSVRAVDAIVAAEDNLERAERRLHNERSNLRVGLGATRRSKIEELP